MVEKLRDVVVADLNKREGGRVGGPREIWRYTHRAAGVGMYSRGRAAQRWPVNPSLEPEVTEGLPINDISGYGGVRGAGGQNGHTFRFY